MPNWTENRLTVEGDPSLLRAFVEAVRGPSRKEDEEPEALDFEQHVPTPPELLADDYVPRDGLPDWYTWRRKHWGTKWNAMWPTREGEPDDGSVTYQFSTAWAPPDAWLHRVAAAHPQLTFQHEYVEEMAQFAGRGILVAGQLTYHEELDPYSIEWVEWEEPEDE